MRTALLTAGSALVLTSALAGCSFSVGSSQLNTQNVEDLIVGNLEDAGTNLNATADCPSDVQIQSGGTFDCTATIQNAGNVTYKVTQTDDQGNVQLQRQEAVMPTSAVEQEITKGITQQVQGNWTVTCGAESASPPPVIIQAPGATFACEASDGSELVPVEVTVKDADGNFTWKTKES